MDTPQLGVPGARRPGRGERSWPQRARLEAAFACARDHHAASRTRCGPPRSGRAVSPSARRRDERSETLLEGSGQPVLVATGLRTPSPPLPPRQTNPFQRLALPRAGAGDRGMLADVADDAGSGGARAACAGPPPPLAQRGTERGLDRRKRANGDGLPGHRSTPPRGRLPLDWTIHNVRLTSALRGGASASGRASWRGDDILALAGSTGQRPRPGSRYRRFAAPSSPPSFAGVYPQCKPRGGPQRARTVAGVLVYLPSGRSVRTWDRDLLARGGRRGQPAGASPAGRRGAVAPGGAAKSAPRLAIAPRSPPSSAGSRTLVRTSRRGRRSGFGTSQALNSGVLSWLTFACRRRPAVSRCGGAARRQGRASTSRGRDGRRALAPGQTVGAGASPAGARDPARFDPADISRTFVDELRRASPPAEPFRAAVRPQGEVRRPAPRGETWRGRGVRPRRIDGVEDELRAS